MPKKPTQEKLFDTQESAAPEVVQIVSGKLAGKISRTRATLRRQTGELERERTKFAAMRDNFVSMSILLRQERRVKKIMERMRTTDMKLFGLMAATREDDCAPNSYQEHEQAERTKRGQGDG